jgi:hypothetical protein
MALLKKSILGRIQREETFESPEAFLAFQQKLDRLRERGAVEELPPEAHPLSPDHGQWFRDTRSGQVYSLIAPDFPSAGQWKKIEEPATESFFERLMPVNEVPREQGEKLLALLEKKAAAGEVQRAVSPGEHGPMWLFYHPPTDECFALTPVPEAPGAWAAHYDWSKLYRSPNDGSWPGDDAELR